MANIKRAIEENLKKESFYKTWAGFRKKKKIKGHDYPGVSNNRKLLPLKLEGARGAGVPRTWQEPQLPESAVS